MTFVLLFRRTARRELNLQAAVLYTNTSWQQADFETAAVIQHQTIPPLQIRYYCCSPESWKIWTSRSIIKVYRSSSAVCYSSTRFQWNRCRSRCAGSRARAAAALSYTYDNGTYDNGTECCCWPHNTLTPSPQGKGATRQHTGTAVLQTPQHCRSAVAVHPPPCYLQYCCGIIGVTRGNTFYTIYELQNTTYTA